MLIELCLSVALNVPHQRIAAVVQPVMYAAERHSVDPAMLFAIAKHESNFITDVVGISGDLGLMQINPYYHMHRFNNVDWRNPWANASVGAFIFADNLRVTGTVRTALKRYNGGNEAARKPSPKVRAYAEQVMVSYAKARKCFDGGQVGKPLL